MKAGGEKMLKNCVENGGDVGDDKEKQYIRSVHEVLKWQQPNIPTAGCAINVIQRTKE